MNKTQTIFGLSILLIIILSMGTMFKTSLFESFQSNGSKLNYKPIISTNNLNGNLRYPGNKYISVANRPYYLNHKQEKSDDEPTFFGFS